MNCRTLNVVADLGTSMLTGLGGRFCLSGGEAINLQTGSRRNWVSKGDLSPQQSTTALLLTASLSAGIYCSPSAGGTVIYAPSINNIIRMITPLVR